MSVKGELAAAQAEPVAVAKAELASLSLSGVEGALSVVDGVPVAALLLLLPARMSRMLCAVVAVEMVDRGRGDHSGTKPA